MILTFKILFLSLAVFFTIVNTGRAMCKTDVPSGNIVWHTVGIVGFVTLQWLI